MRYTSKFFIDKIREGDKISIVWEGGSDGDFEWGLGSQFYELRKALPGKPGLGVLHYLEKTLNQVERKKKHSIRVTDFLVRARAEGVFHPIFDCVDIFGKDRRRYYIGRSIPGIVWSNNWVLGNFDTTEFEHDMYMIVVHVLEKHLKELNVGSTWTGFDTRMNNFLLNDIFVEFLRGEKNQDIVRKIGENSREIWKLDMDEWHMRGFSWGTRLSRQQEWLVEEMRQKSLELENEVTILENEVLTLWSEAWAQVYLFDFGTWKLPK